MPLNEIEIAKNLKISDAGVVFKDVLKLQGSTIGEQTIFVSPTGSDVIGDGTESKPFATRQKAYDSLPKFIAHNVTIRLAAGTYYERAKFPALNISPNAYVRICGELAESIEYTCSGGSAVDADGYAVFTVPGATWTPDEHVGKMLLIIEESVGVLVSSKYIPIRSNTSDSIKTPYQFFTPSESTKFKVVSPLTIINATSGDAEFISKSTIDSNGLEVGSYTVYRLQYEALKILNPDYAFLNEGFYSAFGIWLERDTSISGPVFFSRSGAKSYVNGVMASGYINAIAGSLDYSSDWIFNILCSFSGYLGADHIYPFNPGNNSSMIAAQFILAGSASKKINSVMIANAFGSQGALYSGRIDHANNILRSLSGGYVNSFLADSLYGADNGKLYNVKVGGRANFVSQQGLSCTAEVDVDDSGLITRYVASADEFLSVTKTPYAVTPSAATVLQSARAELLLTPGSDILFTATPTIVNGLFNGQKIKIVNAGLYKVTLQDDDTLSGSKIKLKNKSSITLNQNEFAVFNWDGTNWCEWKDVFAGSDVKTIDVDISSDDIKALYNTPKVLVPAAGAGKAVLIDNIMLSYAYGGTQYAAGGTMSIKYAGTSPHLMTTLNLDSLLTASTANFIRAFPMATSTGGVTLVENKDVVLTCASGNFTSGNGAMKASVQYRIIDL